MVPQPSPKPPPLGAVPRISVVTPSFNQARFLPETFRSVLGQSYPDLEYVVIDGGSTDGSAEIIRRHAEHLSFWTSETDGGQYDAINKGFARTSGDVMAWLNSDDLYTPWALRVVGEVFSQLPQVEWVTTLLPLHWDEHGLPTRCSPVEGFSKHGFFRGRHLPRPGEMDKWFIQQESTFWRRSLWEKAGGRIDSSLHLAGDFELSGAVLPARRLVRNPPAAGRISPARRAEDRAPHERVSERGGAGSRPPRRTGGFCS